MASRAGTAESLCLATLAWALCFDIMMLNDLWWLELRVVCWLDVPWPLM